MKTYSEAIYKNIVLYGVAACPAAARKSSDFFAAYSEKTLTARKGGCRFCFAKPALLRAAAGLNTYQSFPVFFNVFFKRKL